MFVVACFSRSNLVRSWIYSDFGLSLLFSVVVVVVAAGPEAEMLSTGDSSSSSEYEDGSWPGRSSFPTKVYFSIEIIEKQKLYIQISHFVNMVEHTLELHFPFVDRIHFHCAQITQVVVFVVFSGSHLERRQTSRSVATGEYSIWST